MKTYRIRFKIDSNVIVWERSGSDIESCLSSAKTAIKQAHGDKWNGGIAICGPQVDGESYNF